MTESEFLFSMDAMPATPSGKAAYSATCDAGTLSEMAVAAEAASRGWAAYFPIGHSTKADLILWRPPWRPISIQVKKASYQRQGSGSFKFMVGSGKPSCAANPKDYGLRYSRYRTGDFDFLCAHIAEKGIFAFYALAEIAGKSSHHWRPDSGHPTNNWHMIEGNK